MEVSARGWNRDMGKNNLAEVDLSEIAVNNDPRKTVQWNGTSIFKSWGEVGIHWRQKMAFTGNYRMEINLTSSDMVHLFKIWNGRQLDVDLIDNYGFTVSAELKKRILGEIRLADLTIGDLASLGAAPPKDNSKTEQETPGSVSSFRRRF